MTGDRARTALSECLPILFNKRGRLSSPPDLGGYRSMADRISDKLHVKGFRIISQKAYDRLLMAALVNAGTRSQVEIVNTQRRLEEVE